MDSILVELESMAQSVTILVDPQDYVDDEAVLRWQSLFGYTRSEAAKKLREHRESLNRFCVSNSHWDLVCDKMMSLGYDKEAYEYSCGQPQNKTTGLTSSKENLRAKFLLKLEGRLADVAAVKRMGNLENIPTMLYGIDDSGCAASFCKVDGSAKREIEKALALLDQEYQPTFVRCAIADKELYSWSRYPTLGIEITMPQHRPSKIGTSVLPTQDQYPVWYFFYGTLANEEVFRDITGVQPRYRPACVRGGMLKAWGGKYKAMVNGSLERDIVAGQAHLVQSRDEETALLVYETDKYEVVRCRIEIDERGIMDGLTFRYIED